MNITPSEAETAITKPYLSNLNLVILWRGFFVNQKCAMKIGWVIDPINGSARLLIKKRDNAFLP